MLKESPVEEVVAGIQAAAAGQALISPRIAALLLARLREQAQAQRDVTTMHLSQRELCRCARAAARPARGTSGPNARSARAHGSATASADRRRCA